MPFFLENTRTLSASLACVLVACSNADKPGGPAQAGPSCHGKKGIAGESTVSITEPDAPDGGLREAIVHVPASYDATKPTMLVLNFHGLIQPNSLIEQISHMSETSDERGFIVAYPQGLIATDAALTAKIEALGFGAGVTAVSWNAGTCCGNSYDDVGFIRDLVTLLESEYCIDPKRVFATGLSNGAMLSYRLACEASDVFAAVAPVAGPIMVNPCSPGRPVPVLAFHGTADAPIPFNGGIDGIVNLFTFPPVSYTIDLWRSLNSCPNSPLPDASRFAPRPDDSTADGGPNPSLFAGATLASQNGDSACHVWSGCKESSEVELCTIVGGGHTWPGGLESQPFGKTSRDIDATETIIDFFEKHPMP